MARHYSHRQFSVLSLVSRQPFKNGLACFANREAICCEGHACA